MAVARLLHYMKPFFADRLPVLPSVEGEIGAGGTGSHQFAGAGPGNAGAEAKGRNKRVGPGFASVCRERTVVPAQRIVTVVAAYRHTPPGIQEGDGESAGAGAALYNRQCKGLPLLPLIFQEAGGIPAGGEAIC